MTDTVAISLAKDDWTEVSVGNQNGYLTNNTQHRILIRSALVKPDADNKDGHYLNPQGHQPFYLVGSEKVYARGVDSKGRVVLTPGFIFNKDGNISRDFLTEVNQGNVPGFELVHKFGSNPDVGTTTEDVWEQGGLVPWMEFAETLVVASTNVNDVTTGTGAWDVVIKSLDDDFNEIIETIDLLALPLTTLTPSRRIQTLEVGGVGAYTGSNLGVITLTGSVTGDVHGTIPIGNGRSSQSQFTVPNGKTGYILRVAISMDTGKSVNVNIHNRQGADIVVAPFKPNLHLHHWDGISTPVNERLLANHRLPQKTDVWFDAVVPATAASVDVDYDILLVDN